MVTARRMTTAITAVVVAAASIAPSASAAPPAPPDPSTTTAASPEADGEPAGTAAAPPPGDVVQSWALMPGGSLDPDEAGNRPELSYAAAPGSTIDDTVILANYGNVPLTFRVYATDAFNNDEGAFDVLPGDEVPAGVGSWVRVAQEVVNVPPGREAVIPITIEVPPDARPGDHVGAVLASSATTGSNDSGQVVTLDRRTGTRLYLRVDGELRPELAVADVDAGYAESLDPLGGSAEVTFRIENRGNVRLGGTPTVVVAGPFGLAERRVELPPFVDLLPGEDLTLTAQLDDVPALVVATATVTIDPAGDDDVPSASASARTLAAPISVLLVLLAATLGTLAARRLRRHRRAAAASPAELAPAAEATSDEPEPQPA